MWESFFGFKKTPFSDNPDGKQLFASAAWQQVKTRLDFLIRHPGVGLLTGEVGAGKSTAARSLLRASLDPNLHKVLYVHFSSGTALDLLRQIALTLIWSPHIFAVTWSGTPPPPSCASIKAISNIRFSSAMKLTCCRIPRSSKLPLLLNFDMDSSRYLTLLLVGQPLLRRTLSLQMNQPLRQRIGTHYHLEGLSREELDAYLAQQLKAAGAQPSPCSTTLPARVCIKPLRASPAR